MKTRIRVPTWFLPTWNCPLSKAESLPKNNMEPANGLCGRAPVFESFAVKPTLKSNVPAMTQILNSHPNGPSPQTSSTWPQPEQQILVYKNDVVMEWDLDPWGHVMRHPAVRRGLSKSGLLHQTSFGGSRGLGTAYNWDCGPACSLHKRLFVGHLNQKVGRLAQLNIPLTTIASTFVGSYCRALYRNFS